MLHTLLLFIHFFCAAAIVALVLLQRGKGAEAGAGFGAGASGTVFGARGATTALSRTTAILAAVFMLTSLSLAYVGTHGATTSNSLLDRLSQQKAPGGASVPGLPPRSAPRAARRAPNNNAAPAASAAPAGSGTAGEQPRAATGPAASGNAAGGAGGTLGTPPTAAPAPSSASGTSGGSPGH